MKRDSIDVAGLAQVNRMEALLRDVIRSGGADNWAHLFSHGHKHPTVRSAIRSGYLREVRAYYYELKDDGRSYITSLPAPPVEQAKTEVEG